MGYVNGAPSLDSIRIEPLAASFGGYSPELAPPRNQSRFTIVAGSLIATGILCCLFRRPILAKLTLFKRSAAAELAIRRSTTPQSRLFPTFESFRQRGTSSPPYNNFIHYFKAVEIPEEVRGDPIVVQMMMSKRGQPLFARFAEEQPELEKRLTEWVTRWAKDPRLTSEKPLAAIESSLYRAYKIMASYDDLLVGKPARYLTA